MSQLSAPLVLEITTRTLSVCGTALAVSLLLGLPIGIWLGRRRFRGRVLGVSLVNAGMGAPPVVVGLLVSMLLWRSGPLAALDLMYSPAAMVIAQIVIALPLVVGITLAATRTGSSRCEPSASRRRSAPGSWCARSAWACSPP
jgi:tungstate transport system permease protein